MKISTGTQTQTWDTANPARVLAAMALFVGAAIVLAGCGNVMSEPRSIDVTTEFSHTDRVLAGTAVVFGGTKIGQVTKLSSSEDKSIVTLSLDRDKAGIVKETATATISLGSPAQIVLNNPVATAESVKAGAMIKGVNSPFEDTARHAGEAIGTMQEALQQAAATFQNYLESDEWQRSQNEVQRNLNDLGKHSAEAADTMRKGINEMMRDLESRTEETMKDSGKHFSEIEKELRRFGEDGQKDLLDTIQRLLNSLQSAIDTAANKPTQI